MSTPAASRAADEGPWFEYEAAFGIDVTPHDVALARTLDWYEQNPLA